MGEMKEIIGLDNDGFPYLPKPKVFTKPWNADKWLGEAPERHWRLGNKKLIAFDAMEFGHLMNTVAMIERGDPQHKSRDIYKKLKAEIRRREKEI